MGGGTCLVTVDLPTRLLLPLAVTSLLGFKASFRGRSAGSCWAVLVLVRFSVRPPPPREGKYGIGTLSAEVGSGDVLLSGDRASPPRGVAACLPGILVKYPGANWTAGPYSYPLSRSRGLKRLDGFSNSMVDVEAWWLAGLSWRGC
jgi:hypothetical protein